LSSVADSGLEAVRVSEHEPRLEPVDERFPCCSPGQAHPDVQQQLARMPAARAVGQPVSVKAGVARNKPLNSKQMKRLISQTPQLDDTYNLAATVHINNRRAPAPFPRHELLISAPKLDSCLAGDAT